MALPKGDLKYCPRCKKHQTKPFFWPRTWARDDGYCRVCSNARRREWYHSDIAKGRDTVRRAESRDPRFRLFRHAKGRAKIQSVPFSLCLDDIVMPDRCPILGVVMRPAVGQVNDTSPTLDKIIPALGYVPGNVAVISHRANLIKRDATLQELQSLVAWVERNSPQCQNVLQPTGD